MEAIRHVEADDQDLALESPISELESPISDLDPLVIDLPIIARPGPRELELLAPPRLSMTVLKTRVDVISGNDVLRTLVTRSQGRARHLCYVNAHSLNLAYRDDAFAEALGRADLVLNDGIGLDLAARMQGRSFYENLNGSDFTLRMLNVAANEGWRVFLYGGLPGVAETARTTLQGTIDGLEVVGVCDGYRKESGEEIAARIRRSGADMVIVALGQPKQELWLDTHLEATGCHLGVGVGAFLDFVSGRVSRAPVWMNRAGVEWIYRLVQEPSRMWRRYVMGNPQFLWRAWRHRAAND